jgi:hypothetical protein
MQIASKFELYRTDPNYVDIERSDRMLAQHTRNEALELMHDLGRLTRTYCDELGNYHEALRGSYGKLGECFIRL